jgi:LmbE family N-acetylglucosaminyl deacetylase
MDEMDSLNIGRLAVIEPHADDLILAGGGLVKKVTDNGGVVDRVTLTLGGSMAKNSSKMATQRKEECAQSDKLLGIKPSNTYQWEYEVRDLHVNGKEIYDRLFELFRKIRPDTILTMHYDGKHPDHMWIGEFIEPLCFQLAEGIKLHMGNRLNVNLLLGENPRSRFLIQDEFYLANEQDERALELVKTLLNGNPRSRLNLPNYYVNMENAYDTKLAAMKTQVSQLDNLGEGIFEMITKLALKRGMEAPNKCKYAEAFIRVPIADPYIFYG